MGSLYDADILLWSEQQADLLRRLARGERVDGAVDWENLIEEVGDVGRGECNKVAGSLQCALVCLLLACASPSPERIGHWRAEAKPALADAARRFSPSMGQRLDLEEIWSVAAAVARRKLASDGGPARPWPGACPFAVADLMRRPPDLDALLARLSDAVGP